MELKLFNKNESIYIFQLDKKNYIKFCPKRGGLVTNWVSDEKEILRTQLDASTGLPRVGINRTGQRVNDVQIDAGGSGYISPPTVTIAAPPGGDDHDKELVLYPSY